MQQKFKLDRLSLSAIPDRQPQACRRLTVFDKSSGLKFLVDTANKSPIKTFGRKRLSLSLGLRRAFSWNFTIAKVSQPILGADFLGYHNLVVDLRNRKLHDGITNLSVNCVLTAVNHPISGLSAINNDDEFHTLLKEFPVIINDSPVSLVSTRDVFHHIVTNGPPVFSKFRRLSPDMMKAAKAEIQSLLDAGICRPSNSP
ncbi:uncharacterized protein LOC119667426 [Teleopsis dalmanni]|uniref:uncharacterized protein LOC119665606 n=1 Tax=Teleopsis dalmanni TaxID=139649 RepID=UPI0018CD3206|nr:uncharacterized protein LOC119665606 [Teleopsis dalmanni]XP_037932643.1 uncharacterized protein LOC119667426 [Teleopsis dalmanni]